jgi:hypothetical protein
MDLTEGRNSEFELQVKDITGVFRFPQTTPNVIAVEAFSPKSASRRRPQLSKQRRLWPTQDALWRQLDQDL